MPEPPAFSVANAAGGALNKHAVIMTTSIIESIALEVSLVFIQEKAEAEIVPLLSIRRERGAASLV